MEIDTLKKLNIAELVEYGNQNLGLGVTKDYAKGDIINMILQGQRKFKGNAAIRVLSDGDTSKVPPGMIKIRVRPGKYDRIPRPVIIGHQFKLCSVPVNRDVLIPAKYLVCFEDAVQDVYFQQDNDDGTKEFVCQKEHAYSYSVLERGPEIPKPEAAIPDDVKDEAEEAA